MVWDNGVLNQTANYVLMPNQQNATNFNNITSWDKNLFTHFKDYYEQNQYLLESSAVNTTIVGFVTTSVTPLDNTILSLQVIYYSTDKQVCALMD